MDRNSRAILGACIVSGLVACVALAMMGTENALKDAGPALSLECSVDDDLSFVAFNVTEWNMREGTLTLTSRDDGAPYVMARTMVAGETCREVFP